MLKKILALKAKPKVVEKILENESSDG